MKRSGWGMLLALELACAASPRQAQLGEGSGDEAPDSVSAEAPDLDSDPRALDPALAEAARRDARRAAARSVLRSSGERWQVRTLTEPERPTPALGRKARVDVRFHDAELEEALRLLADAGGFAFVAEGELTGRVSIELSRVRPYDALVAIAQAHGARVTRQGVVVVVTPGR